MRIPDGCRLNTAHTRTWDETAIEKTHPTLGLRAFCQKKQMVSSTMNFSMKRIHLLHGHFSVFIEH